MFKHYLIICLTLCFSGCASIVNDSILPMKVDTKNTNGEFVTGAKCRLESEDGTYDVVSGDQIIIERSNEDLSVTCKHPDNPDATGTVISRANSGLFGNILFGGGVGAIIDHNTGKAYTYPSWIQLVFGKFLIFDRADEEDGKPLTGKEPEVKEEEKLAVN